MPETVSFFICAALTLVFGFLVHRLVFGPRLSGDGSAANLLALAEARLTTARDFAGILFLVSGAFKVALYAGWIAMSLKPLLAIAVGVPFLIAAAVYLRAWVDVKRGQRRT